MRKLDPLIKGVVSAVLLTCGVASVPAQQDYFSNWPMGDSPQEVGKRVAEHFISSPHQGNSIFYGEVATWYGALTFAQLTSDKDLQAKLIGRFDPLLPGGAETNLIGTRRHVDDEIFGVIPLEIFLLTKDQKYLSYGKEYADRQWENPRPDGLSSETRFWIDDMYMLTILQLEAYRATEDRRYLDRSALEMVAYLDKLQQPDGLFYHAPDVPYFWGRGDGWVAAGMAEILQDLPADHPQRARILKGYKRMMAALLRFQGKDGMWRQLIDHEEAWPESSSSGMFTFAMITGVKNGWLDAPTYGPAARKAWIAVAGYVDQNSDVTSVCEGTNKKDDLEYYLERRRRTGDYHGQAPILWAASALLRPRVLANSSQLDTDPRVQELIATLHLSVLPKESGYLGLIGESAQKVSIDGRQLPVQSQVYYMLTRDRPTNYLHRLESDDTHILIEGGPVDYFIFHPDGRTEKVTLGRDVAHGERPLVAVPGGCWKALRLQPGAAYALMANALSPAWTPDRVRIGEGAAWVKRFSGTASWATPENLRAMIGPNWRP